MDLTNHFGATIRHHREHWESSQQLCRTNPKSSHSVLALQISAEVHHLSFVSQCAVLRSSADKVVFIYHAARKTDNKHARYVQIMCHVVYIINFYFLNTFKMLFTMFFRLEFNWGLLWNPYNVGPKYGIRVCLNKSWIYVISWSHQGQTGSMFNLSRVNYYTTNKFHATFVHIRADKLNHFFCIRLNTLKINPRTKIEWIRITLFDAL